MWFGVVRVVAVLELEFSSLFGVLGGGPVWDVSPILYIVIPGGRLLRRWFALSWSSLAVRLSKVV